MDEWDKIAEGLLIPFVDRLIKIEDLRIAFAAKLREVGDQIERQRKGMGEWHEIAHKRKGVIADLKAEIKRLKKSYEHDHQLCLDQAAIVIEANTEVNQLRADRDAAQQEIERLKEYTSPGEEQLRRAAVEITAKMKLWHSTYPLTHKWIQHDYSVVASVIGPLLRAAYLKGLEEGKSIADKSYFQIGVLKYPCTEVADAIQSRIDEAKGK